MNMIIRSLPRVFLGCAALLLQACVASDWQFWGSDENATVVSVDALNAAESGQKLQMYVYPPVEGEAAEGYEVTIDL